MKEVWCEMESKNQLSYYKKQLQLYFIELLYSEKWINKETYYKAKRLLCAETNDAFLYSCIGKGVYSYTALEMCMFALRSRPDCRLENS